MPVIKCMSYEETPPPKKKKNKTKQNKTKRKEKNKRLNFVESKCTPITIKTNEHSSFETDF